MKINNKSHKSLENEEINQLYKIRKNKGNTCQKVCIAIALISLILNLVLLFLMAQEKPTCQIPDNSSIFLEEIKSQNLTEEKKNNETLAPQKLTEEKKNNETLAEEEVQSKFQSPTVPLEKFEVEIYEKIEEKAPKLSGLNFNRPCPNSENDRKFLNGLIRKYKPKKLLEVGVDGGCTSVVLLNAIADIEGAFLYSIDSGYKSKYGPKIGFFVETFPELKSKWKLYLGGQTYKFIEEIGNRIEFLLLDTKHSLPGEFIDILQVLPFFNENAIIALHDINYGFESSFIKYNPSNTILFSILRGIKIIPRLKEGAINPLGAIILDKNQKQYYFDYFFSLGQTWNYVPQEKEINKIITFFEKYYEQQYIDLFKIVYKANKKKK